MKILQYIGITLFGISLLLFSGIHLLESYELNDSGLERLAGIVEDKHQAKFLDELADLKGITFTKTALLREIDKLIAEANQELDDNSKIWEYQKGQYRLWTIRYASNGIVSKHKSLISFLILVFGLGGALMHIIPLFYIGSPGIKNDGIFTNPATSAGWSGIVVGCYLIAFYIVLYFYPEYLAESISLTDPLSNWMNGSDSSQWFLYGVLYTLAVLVMGVRMFAKYRHSKYQQIRTASVMFFQLGFAFLMPEILRSLSLPAPDLKNIWPLDYSFFYDYRLSEMQNSGTFGLILLFWGLALIFIAVPILTYIFGKRWYCSWVCGCGGLAETLGDPYRQLSDKSLEAWQIERVLIHSVLAFVVFMTALVLLNYLGWASINWAINGWWIAGIAWVEGLSLWAYHRKKYPYMKGQKILATVAVFAGAITIGVAIHQLDQGGQIRFDAYKVREIYGFSISSIFAGVVGTGFYPIMGNRVWCRFGCPLAAIFGFIQRFKSRFRITTNGGQCISCGNCSTYCEQGIDVKWYAQRGQDIVRSSCVGCGVCSAVCPRGVLNLENEDPASRNLQIRELDK